MLRLELTMILISSVFKLWCSSAPEYKLYYAGLSAILMTKCQEVITNLTKSKLNISEFLQFLLKFSSKFT